MSYKKRLLFVGEASFLATGFSTYYRELLSRLAATGKYEIAEIGSYARGDDPRVTEFINGRWKFYGGLPSNPEEAHKFQNLPRNNRNSQANAGGTAQFGEWIFDEVCAEFKPDFVFDIRDFWMCEFQERSIFRPWYKWILMPTVDAEPQNETWMNVYEKADLLLTYSDYGIHALKRQSSLAKVFPKPMRPGVDMETFYPFQNKHQRRKEKFMLNEDVPVIGTVMRNQSVDGESYIVTSNGLKKFKNIRLGDRVLTAQGRLMPVTNAWSYQERKEYTTLDVIGNIYGPNATSEHKFWFEGGQKPIGEATLQDRIRLSTIPRSDNNVVIDIADYVDMELLPDYTLSDEYFISKDSKYKRNILITDDIMRLLALYYEAGHRSDARTTYFDRVDNEIISIVKKEFNDDVVIDDTDFFYDPASTWTNPVWAYFLENLFKNDEIPFAIVNSNNSIHFVAKLTELIARNKTIENKLTLSKSRIHSLYQIRDIFLSNGIFVSMTAGRFSPELTISGKFLDNFSQYLRGFDNKNTCHDDEGVEWVDNSYFLVPVLEVRKDFRSGPFYDLEVQEDYTYNVLGYACNNSRKLYPDLINAFAKMKNKYRGNPYVDKAVLMIHSSWPDNAYSFDYPRYITRLQSMKDWIPNGYNNAISDFLQTYKCHSCKKTSLGFAQVLHNRPITDGRIKVACTNCGAIDASPPVTGSGFTREELAEVYNAMDVYVQCSICEGDGMPIQEAKACGVPTLAVDYSAMSEKGRFPKEYKHLKGQEKTYNCHLGGDIIDVERFYYEPETSCMRAMPDIDDLAEKMMKLISDRKLRDQMSKDARQCVEENYNWNELSKQWEFVIDNVNVKDRSQTWDSPITPFTSSFQYVADESLTNEEYIEWLYKTVLEYPKVDPDGAQMWLNHLLSGITRERLLSEFLKIKSGNSNDESERQRIRARVAGQQIVIEDRSDWI